MKELLTYIARSLVDDPDAVSVSEYETPAEKVIGRQGRIAKEIRALMRSVAQRQGKKLSVDIVD